MAEKGNEEEAKKGKKECAKAGVYQASTNSVVFSLKNQVGGLAKALQVFKVSQVFF